jgi:G3E family GTPase
MIKVFLVEDEKIIRKSIKNNVKWEENGFEFAGEAPDGEMALPMIEKLHPDIVITDIKMPFMDGLELSDILNKLCNDDNVLRAKGFVDSGNEDWWYFDLVPGEFEIRLGKPIYTGQVCVIGKDLDENTIKELFLG